MHYFCGALNGYDTEFFLLYLHEICSNKLLEIKLQCALKFDINTLRNCGHYVVHLYLLK